LKSSSGSAGIVTGYLLWSESEPEQTCIGLTSDLKIRLAKHNEGGSPHTAKHRPWSLVTYIAFRDRSRTADFERYLKSGSGRAVKIGSGESKNTRYSHATSMRFCSSNPGLAAMKIFLSLHKSFIPYTVAALLSLPGVRAGVVPGSKNIGAVWFIGDSITQGIYDGDSGGSPRKSLYDLLVANGYTFTFTGHYAANVDGLPVTGATPETNLYHYHSGISGSVIGNDISGRVGMTQNQAGFWTTGRLASVKPNVILIMLGTNDVDQNIDLANAPARLTTLVNTIYSHRGVGKPTVLVASIPPNRTNVPADPTNTATFNAAVPGVVNAQQALGRDVRFVDQFTPLENGYATNMRSDNLHTNATGNNTLALQWFNMIQAIVNTPDYDVWKTSNFGAPFTDTAPDSDPDGDGLSNREEHAFGLNPTSASSVNPIIQPLDPASGRFRYTRRATSGLNYKVFTSTSLQSWALDAGATEVLVTTSGTVQTVTVQLSATPADGRLFVRVHAQ
jgi:predicted GIY-YIG superfamily endonuclease